jgi:Lrp/AsnC family leucine-responsive transcriptional regulator
MATMHEFDTIESAILDQLQADDRLSLAELGKVAGLSVSATKERVSKLVARGVITGFHAHVDAESVGLDLLAHVFVGWSNPATEAPFLKSVLAEPTILECHHVSGSWNYMLKARVRNPRMLEALLAHVIKAVPGVERTETIIVLSTAKETARLPTARPAWMDQARPAAAA